MTSKAFCICHNGDTSGCPFHAGDRMYCKNCSTPIYITVSQVTGLEQYIHTHTGCHYCDSVRPNKEKVAEPNVPINA